MRTLKQIREDIESNQIEYRRVSSLNLGLIKGSTDTQKLQVEILDDIDEYNRRSARDKFERGILKKRRD